MPYRLRGVFDDGPGHIDREYLLHGDALQGDVLLYGQRKAPCEHRSVWIVVGRFDVESGDLDLVVLVLRRYRATIRHMDGDRLAPGYGQVDMLDAHAHVCVGSPEAGGVDEEGRHGCEHSDRHDIPPCVGLGAKRSTDPGVFTPMPPGNCTW
jgi:hypothetical protein